MQTVFLAFFNRCSRKGGSRPKHYKYRVSKDFGTAGASGQQHGAGILLLKTLSSAARKHFSWFKQKMGQNSIPTPYISKLFQDLGFHKSKTGPRFFCLSFPNFIVFLVFLKSQRVCRGAKIVFCKLSGYQNKGFRKKMHSFVLRFLCWRKRKENHGKGKI